jgi:hypothetical protein
MPSRLRPRTVSELVDVEFELLRRHYASFLTIVAVGLAPVVALGIALGVGAAVLGAGAKHSGVSPALIGGVVTAALAMIACFIVLQGALIHAASDAYLEDRVDVADAFRRAAARTGTIFLAYALAAVIVLVGYVMLIVPGIYFGLALFAVPAIVLLEGVGPGDAVSRSFALTKGRKWAVLGALLVAGLISFAGRMTLGFAANVFGSVGLALAGQILGFVAFYPVTTVMVVLLYYDSRIRVEGFDLERAAAALESEAA